MVLDPLKILLDLVSINTVNSPEQGLKPSVEAPNKIREILHGIGVNAEILEKNGFYSVFGVLGEGKPIIMFMAQFDTVPVNISEWKYNPFTLTLVGDVAYGRGSIDDKSNVAAMICAIERIVSRGFKGTLIFAFTGDEEIGGRNGAGMIRDKLLEAGLKPDYLVNGDGNGMLVIVRRRCGFGFRVRVKEVKREINGIRFSKRFNVETPVYETRHAAYFMPGVDLHPLIAASYYLRLNPNLYVIGIKGDFSKSNVIPGWVELELVNPDVHGERVIVDEGLTKLLRAVIPLVRTPLKPELYSDFGVSITPNYYLYSGGVHYLNFDIRAMTTDLGFLHPLRETLLRNVPGAECEFSGGIGYLYTDENEDIVRFALEVLDGLGVKSGVVEACGASDSRFFAPIGVKCIDFGPVGGNIHGPNEYLEVSSLYKTVDFYERLFYRLTSH
ncbi:MAG: M20/M25/M40 family metallo-hydrolase [Candidatus Methanomethylicia archaeon]